MATSEYVDLSRNMIAEPLDSYRIGENRYAVAGHTASKPNMLTYGISPCKGIAIYNPGSQLGLVAHLSVTPRLESTLGKLTNAMGDLSGSEVHIVQAMQSQSASWPKLEDIADFFMHKNPRALRIDSNAPGKSVRGIALNLLNGAVSEIDGSNGWTWSDEQDTSLNEYLYDADLGY